MAMSRTTMLTTALALIYISFILFFTTLYTNANAATAQYADLDYDVVYIRCSRGDEPVTHPFNTHKYNWNGGNDIWISASNNVYQQPGCDLVMHDSSGPSGSRNNEKVLVECTNCTIMDPNVSFDGKKIIYSKILNTTNGFVTKAPKGTGVGRNPGHQSSTAGYSLSKNEKGLFGNRVNSKMAPYNSPYLVFEYNIETGRERQVSPAPVFKKGQNIVPSDLPVMDTGPFYTPDGRIGFTTNRFSQHYRFELSRNGQRRQKLGFLWASRDESAITSLLY